MPLSYADAMKKKREGAQKPSKTQSSSHGPSQKDSSSNVPQHQHPPSSQKDTGDQATPSNINVTKKKQRNKQSPWGAATSKRAPIVASQPSTSTKPTQKKNQIIATGGSKTKVQILTKEKQPAAPSPWKEAAMASAKANAPPVRPKQKKPPIKENSSSTSRDDKPKQPPSQTQESKKKKPKPQLKSMSIGDVLKVSRPGSDGSMKPKKGATPILTSTSQFPALGSRTAQLKQPVMKLWGKSAKPPPKKSTGTTSTVSTANNAQSKGLKSEQTKKSKTKTSAISKNGQIDPALSAAMFFQPKIDVERQGDEHKLLRLLEDRTVYQKKGRQRLNPRKKKFSALKKRVLQERLQKWHELHPEEGKDNRAAVTSSICVYNYVKREELEDEDEYDEVVENLNEMAARVGPVDEVYVPRLERDDLYPVFVRFKSAQDASAAQACWEGLLVSGNKLVAVLLQNVQDQSGETWKDQVLMAEASRDSSAAENSDSTTKTIKISGILSEDDYDDEDCMKESLADLNAIAQKFGIVEKIEPAQKKDGDVLISCKGEVTAVQILEGLQNTTIEGKPLSVQIKTDESVNGTQAISVVRLENVLTEDDLEDEECLTETLADIRELAKLHGALSDVRVHEKSIHLVYNEDTLSAKKTADSLNGMTLGGERIIAIVETKDGKDELLNRTLRLRNILSEDDLEDEECLSESMQDIRKLAETHGAVESIEIDKEGEQHLLVVIYDGKDVAAAKNARDAFDGMTFGGLIVSAALDSSLLQPNISSDNLSPFDTKRKPLSEDNVNASKKAKTEDNKPMYSGDKLISERFAEAKRAPKIPNTPGPRPYAKTINDERVRPLLIEMLGELMRLQKRAMEEKNTKVKRRLVLGLREVARGIRSHKVKMVVMANNLDEYGAIDEKLQEIIDLAHNEGVPLFFEFTKRSLGKAIGKTIKVAVIGIQSAEGAHQAFKKLTALSSKL